MLNPLQSIAAHHLILASQSPRRKALLERADLTFSVEAIKDVDESFPPAMAHSAVAIYLAEKKSEAFDRPLKSKEILITADTIVCLHNRILTKPNNAGEAQAMLRELSACEHDVITGVCLRTDSRRLSFYEQTKVFFKKLSKAETAYYINKYQPFDKAGAYGIQEWIGHIGIERIEGCYFNVMGLPVYQVYKHLQKICE